MQQEYITNHEEDKLVKSIFKSEIQDRERSLERAILTILCKDLSDEFNTYNIK